MIRTIDLIAKHVVEFSMCIAYESYQNGEKRRKRDANLTDLAKSAK
jgi:hypothetical protein